jgi:hypothetical protein
MLLPLKPALILQINFLSPNTNGYLQWGSRILRTDKQGAITVITDGENIDVKTFLKDGF